MAAKKSNRFVNQAALEALVRFGPQTDVLRQAQRTAEDTYKTSVGQARNAQLAIQQAIDQALPQAAKIYDRSGLDAARLSQTLIGHDLAGLGNVADSIKGGAALEAAGMGGRLADARANTLTSLNDRRTQAAAGRVATERTALDQLSSDLTKILQQRKDLAGQKGAFQAATIGDLEEAARQRATDIKIASGHDTAAGSRNQSTIDQQERNSLRSAGLDPDKPDGKGGYKPIPGGKADPKAKKKGRTILPGGAELATANEHGTAKDAIHQAQTWIRRLSSSQHMDEATIKDHLVAGDTLTDANNNKLKLPEIAGDYVQAAWEIAHQGGISRQTAAALHDRGLSIKQLGLVSRGSSKGKTVAAETHAFDVVTELARQLAGG